VTSGDSIYSFNATVSNAASPGSKSLPLAITDLEGRSASPAPNIALTVQAPPSVGVRISQVYGGGGNSGATFKNDFIELFNQSDSPVDVSTWSVQKASANLNNWEITNLCPAGGTCVVQPGRYYLVQEAQGLIGRGQLVAAARLAEEGLTRSRRSRAGTIRAAAASNGPAFFGRSHDHRG